jgi:hypothetical protein
MGMPGVLHQQTGVNWEEEKILIQLEFYCPNRTDDEAKANSYEQ